MKKILFVSLVVLVAFGSCATKDAEALAESGAPSKVDTSYAFGVAIGNSIKETEVEIDYKAFLDGVKAVLEGKEPKVTLDEAGATIQAAIELAMEKKGEESKVAEAAFFAENGKKAGIVTTESGLQYEVITEGAGAKPGPTDVVTVHYVGTFLDGEEFDSSVARDEPAVFPLDQVIDGWSEAVQLMNVGAKYRFWLPSDLAYGADGAGGVIPPYSTLIFEVELLEFEDAAAAEAVAE
ncbi:MAG: FKBP-type peptidyl-prolyl cis-trans isomerase [Spirochaetales bacterium]|nr:FKBP-type peptidyl-prolyl cis-trans isomerase [Spirochaetales bacterium]